MDGALRVVPATADRFDDVAVLLAPRGDERACWCLPPRYADSEIATLAAAGGSSGRAAAMRELCRRRPSPGVLAYDGDAVVGWCGIGPRASMGRLARSRSIPTVDDVPVWSIVCLVVRPESRRRGVSRVLVDGAVDHARSQGARCVEAYPIDPEGERVSVALAHVGLLPVFERAGFRRVTETAARSAGRARWLVRLDLDDA